MSEEDMMIIYVTRPYGGGAPAVHIYGYLSKIGTPMYYAKPKTIRENGDPVAVCNTFCVDGFVDRVRLIMMLDKAMLSDRYYIEMWFDIAEQDTTEHVCLGYNGQYWAPSGYESFITSEFPDVTPEYLTEDYAVAFLSGSAEGYVLDTCSFTCRKW